jgi:hypothetical protein
MVAQRFDISAIWYPPYGCRFSGQQFLLQDLSAK